MKRISRKNIDILIKTAKPGDDILGFMQWAKNKELDEQRDIMAELVEEALCATSQDALAEMESYFQNREWKLDQVTASLIASKGLNPLACSVLADTVYYETTDQEMTFKASVSKDGWADNVTMNFQSEDWFVTLSQDIIIQWSSAGLITMADLVLPDSVMLRAKGESLARVLNHPVLDRHNLIIDSITTNGTNTVICVENSLEFLQANEISEIFNKAKSHVHQQ